jgi:DNA-binding NarL/FixJ family response regulator
MIRISVISTKEQDINRLSSLLSAQEDFKIIYRGKNSYDAIKSADDFHPDIIIMDLWMDDINGTDIAPIITRKSPSTKLIAILSSDDTGWIKRALRVSISGFLLKQFDTDTLVNAVRAVLHEGYYLCSEIRCLAHQYFSDWDSWIMADHFPQTPITAGLPEYSGEREPAYSPDLPPAQPAVSEWQGMAGGLPDITNNERKIVTCIAIGKSDKEIAEKLCIALGTVRNCLVSIKRKTGQKTRAQVVVYSLRHGLIGIPPKT